MNGQLVARLTRRDVAFVVARGVALLMWIDALGKFGSILWAVFGGYHVSWQYHVVPTCVAVGVTLIGAWAWFNAARLGSDPDDAVRPAPIDDAILLTRHTIFQGVASAIGLTELIRGGAALLPVLEQVERLPGSKAESYLTTFDVVYYLGLAGIGIAFLSWASYSAKRLDESYLIEDESVLHSLE